MNVVALPGLATIDGCCDIYLDIDYVQSICSPPLVPATISA
jgi:hypothetical protein